MQATLSARPKSIIDLAPRPSIEAISRFTRRGDDFASRLSEARTETRNDLRADRQDDAAKTNAAPAAEDAGAARNSPKPQEPTKRVEEPTTRDNAAAQSDEAPSAKPEASTDVAEEAAPAEEAAGPEVEEGAPVAEVDPTALAADAMPLIALQPAQPTVAADEEASAVEATETPEEISAMALAAVAGVALATASESTDVDAAAAESEGVEAATPELLKAVAEDGKPKTKPGEVAKGTDSKPDAAQAVAVATTKQDGERREQSSDAESQPQQDPSLLATDTGETAIDPKVAKSAESTFDAMLSKLAPVEAGASKPAAPAPTVATPQPSMAPEQQFAAKNVNNMVTGVRTQIEAGGNGQMRIRLDPPELGALEVSVKMTDGRMTAAFTTNNEEATRLLSHSLNNLKSSLEASGITVDRIQVRQATTDNNAQQQPGSGDNRREGGSAFDQPSHRGDQQRKEAVEKMWRKLAYGSDELDFVA